jgi:hypothetical protein
MNNSKDIFSIKIKNIIEKFEKTKQYITNTIHNHHLKYQIIYINITLHIFFISLNKMNNINDINNKKNLIEN